MCEENYSWNPSTCACENCKHSECIIGDSVIMCHKSIEVTKSVPTKTISTKAVSTEMVQRNSIFQSFFH